MRSDLNINDFIEDKKWHEQGSSIVSKWRSIDFSSKVSAANIPDWECMEIYFLRVSDFLLLKENLRLLNWASFIDICHGL